MQIAKCKMAIADLQFSICNLQFAICNSVLFLAAVFASAFALAIVEPAEASGHGSHGGHDSHEAASNVDHDAAAIDAKIRGVELGDYRIRSYYPVQAQKSMVRFVLHAAVPSERYPNVQQVVESYRHKLRDQVITATRLAPLAVFDDPDLTAFRRMILVRLRRALPELEIDDIYVSDFQLSVKSL